MALKSEDIAQTVENEMAGFLVKGTVTSPNRNGGAEYTGLIIQKDKKRRFLFIDRDEKGSGPGGLELFTYEAQGLAPVSISASSKPDSNPLAQLISNHLINATIIGARVDSQDRIIFEFNKGGESIYGSVTNGDEKEECQQPGCLMFMDEEGEEIKCKETVEDVLGANFEGIEIVPKEVAAFSM